MGALLFLLMLPLQLAAFEPRPVAAYAVVGFKEIPFEGDRILLWYPVSKASAAGALAKPGDLFLSAHDARPLAKGPLIILSHGFRGEPTDLSWLVRGLADSGFAVAALRHPDRIEERWHDNRLLQTVETMRRRALDVSKMIDALVHSSAAEAIDFTRIGFAGFSLGGTTGIFLAGGRIDHLDRITLAETLAYRKRSSQAGSAPPALKALEAKKDFREHRIRAYFLMAPASAWIFSDASLRGIANPVYLIGGAADEFLVTEANAGYLAKMLPASYYQTIPGKAGHFAFLTSKRQNARKPTSDPRYTDDPSVDRDWIQSKTLSEAIRFFKETLR